MIGHHGGVSLRNPRQLFVASLLALVIFAAGAAGHFAHHLIDPDCDSGARPTAHPCSVCVALPGGALAESPDPQPVPERFLAARIPPPAIAIGASAVPGVCAPRAPPLT